MKKTFFLLFALALTFDGVAQQSNLGTYGWFTKNKIPHYPKHPESFLDFRTADGVPLSGFMPGYYVDKSGNKVEGEIQYNFPYIMERLVVFRNGATTLFFDPTEIKGYFVDGIYRESVTINVSMIASMKSLETLFMIPDIEGKLSVYYYTGESPEDFDDEADLKDIDNYWEVYQHYLKEKEAGIRHSPKTRVVRKSGAPGMLVDNMAMGFAKKMTQLVEDCPSVAGKVKDKAKGYRAANFEDIVEAYNDCGGN